MGKLFLFVIIFIIAGIFSLVKSSVGKVTGNVDLKNASFKGEAKKVMKKTARGVSWMEEQWEDSKNDAKTNNDNKI